MKKFSVLLCAYILFLFLSCSKEAGKDPDPNDPNDPPYLKGLVKHVELHETDTLTGISEINNDVRFYYDSSKRLSKLEAFKLWSFSPFLKKHAMWMHYANPTTTVPYLITGHDSLQSGPNGTYELSYEHEHKMKFDIQNRKIADTFRFGNFTTGSTSTTITPYKYFTWNNYSYYAGPGTASRRTIYDLSGNFIAIDNEGDSPGNPDVWNVLKVDSSYTDDSPLYFKDVNNAAAYIFSYQHWMFTLPWNFSTLAYEPFFFPKKIPKGVTTIYRNTIDLKLYTIHYFFTLEKTNNQVTRINIVGKAHDPNGVFIGSRTGFIKIIYYQ